ncbi:MAG: hypothetical protein FWH47_03505, partial [Methanomassiliicoccaceae archaeon]|nr:hypothetical protein [Methanomassiliicoccaceae archaeon]
GATQYRSGVEEIGQGYFADAPYALDDAGPSGGWYHVTGDVTLASPISTSGDVHLIMGDGLTLTVTGAGGGIAVSAGSLSVYAQSADSAGGIVATGGAGVSLAGGCALLNTASIASASMGGAGVHASGGATVTNGATGAIHGGSEGVLLSAGGTVDNRGTVVAAGTTASGVLSLAYAKVTNIGSIQSAGAGVSLPAGGHIDNSGAIAAGIGGDAIDASRGTAPVGLSNSGTIVGAVSLPDAPNDVVLVAGSRIYGDFDIGASAGSTISFFGTPDASMQYSVITGTVDIRAATVYIDSASLPPSFSQGDSVVLINAGTGSVALPSAGTVLSTWYSFKLAVEGRQLVAKTSLFTIPPEGVPYVGMSGLMRLQLDAEEIDQAYFASAPYTLDDTGPSNGWYFMSGDVTLPGPLVTSGDVCLIIGDGLTLTVTGPSSGVQVASGSLSVYLMSEGATGGITATGGAGVALSDGCALFNTASIASTSMGGYGVQASGYATVANGEGGVITGASGGVLLDAGGVVENLGTIAATGAFAYGVSSYSYADISNSGTIQSGYTGVGLFAGGAVDNSGSITGGDRGIDADSDAADIVNLAGGVIEGGSYGIYIGQGGVVDNSGIIRCIESYCDGVYASIDTCIVNSGLIEGTWDGLNLFEGGTVVNSGAIAGTDPFGNGIVAFYGALVVTNSGTVEGGARGVRLGAGGDIDNSGTIAAGGDAIYAWGGTAPVTAVIGGAVIGAVTLPDLPNSVVLMAGVTVDGVFSIGSDAGSVIVFSGDPGPSAQYAVVTADADIGAALVLIDGNGLPALSQGDEVVLIDAGSMTAPAYPAVNAAGMDFILTAIAGRLTATVV